MARYRDYQQNYYQNNKERLSAERRARYKRDGEHREAVKQKSKDRYHVRKVLDKARQESSMEEPDVRLWNLQQIADYLVVSLADIQRWVREGVLSEEDVVNSPEGVLFPRLVVMRLKLALMAYDVMDNPTLGALRRMMEGGD